MRRDRWRGTLGREVISTRQGKVAELARREPGPAPECFNRGMALTTLAHHIDAVWMGEAYRRVRKEAVAGVDGMTAVHYEVDREANLSSLLERFESGRYRAPAVRRVRVHLAKPGTEKTRPIGIPTREDKVLQRAVLMVLEPVLRAGVHGVLVWVPTGARRAPGAGSAVGRADGVRWGMGH